MNDKNTFLMEVRNAEFFNGTLATETPVDRNGVDEVLLISPKTVELHTKDVPLLDNHNQGRQIGIVEQIQVVGKKLIGRIRFATDKYSQEIMEDVKEGIRQNLSIGYQVLSHYYDEGKKYVDRFKVLEASVVSIPADANSGFGRDLDSNYSFRTINFNFKETNNMNDEKLSRSERKAEASLREEISEIIALGNKHGKEDLAQRYISEGKGITEFRSALLDSIASKPLETPSFSDGAGFTRKAPAFNKIGNQDYSIARAIESLDDPSKRGLEWEISQDLERTQKKSSPNSILIDTRTMTSGTAGANTIQTNVSANIQDFIQAQMVTMNTNPQVFNGNVGDLLIPVGSSASGATILATDGTTQADITTPTLTNKTLSPTRIADVVPLSYGFLQQSTPDVEGYVRRLIADTFAAKMDEQILVGTGSGGQVQGILGTSGINAVSNGGTEVDYDNFLSALSELGADNVDLTNLSFIVPSSNVDNLASTVKFTSTASPLLDLKAEQGGKIGEIMGYPVYATSQLTADNYLVGDFSHLAVANWGGLEISKNDFYDDRRFICSINAIMSFDSAVLQPTAFCKITKA